ncbi:hypothetical protein [Oceanospirillum maris]|uniref:hypothetical protein n=1 Tax=Oceanospirillum maris TaxID=64977 RepID=UPI0004102A07|nr:hypothetical protein [Oceanospirillum maris]
MKPNQKAHSHKELERELLLAKAELCKLKARDLEDHSQPSIWLVEVEGDATRLTRLKSKPTLKPDQVLESYPLVDAGVASVYLSAINRGFQPPRCLSHLEKPSD